MKNFLFALLLFSTFAHADYIAKSGGGGGGGTVTAVTASPPLASSGGTTPNISCQTASGTQAGCISAADWNTFNSKQPAGNYITALTSDVSASGPGSAVATVNSVGGASASSVASTVTNAALLPGRAGGQTLNGDTAAGNWAVYGTAGNLSFQSNSTATPGYTQITDGSAFILGDPNALAASISTLGGSPPSEVYIASDGNGTFAGAADFVGFSADVYGSNVPSDGVGLSFGATGGTVVAPTALSSGDVESGIYWNVARPGNLNPEAHGTAIIDARATENHSNTNFGTALEFFSTATATSSTVKGLQLLGTTASFYGPQVINGSSSGAITIQAQAAAGTWNFNLPITAGSAGQVLTSQGGGSTAMTWTTPSVAFANQSLSNLTSPTAVNQALLEGNGTVSTPSYAFTNATGSGLFWSSGNGNSGGGIHITAGGSAVFHTSSGTTDNLFFDSMSQSAAGALMFFGPTASYGFIESPNTGAVTMGANGSGQGLTFTVNNNANSVIRIINQASPANIVNASTLANAVHLNPQSGTSYTVALNDTVVAMTNVAARAVTLYDASTVGWGTGQYITIVDGANTAGTAPITITPAVGQTINGASNLVISTNGAAAFLWINGSNWVGSSVPPSANQTLSNLTSPTSINQDLIPSATNTRKLGSSAADWQNLYLGNGTTSVPSVVFPSANGIGFYAPTTSEVGVIAQDSNALVLAPSVKFGNRISGTTAGGYISFANNSSSGVFPGSYIGNASTGRMIYYSTDAYHNFMAHNGVEVIQLYADGTDILLYSNADLVMQNDNVNVIGKAIGSGLVGRPLRIISGLKGFSAQEAANSKQGVSTLSGGTVVVSNTSVTANSRILLTCQDPNGGTPGAESVSTRTAGTSFTITSTSGADTCIIAWEIFEPG